MTVPRRKQRRKTVSNLTHDEAKRLNIPTAEYEAVTKSEACDLAISQHERQPVSAEKEWDPALASRRGGRRLG